ncbi:hypothetical protein [Flavobacterium sp. RSSB_23]|uniref:hypothetical protein n=1 Tax=Flavobacterium sp. RSSB_23 TaxID=3447668 RepID=UPI003F2B25FD
MLHNKKHSFITLFLILFQIQLGTAQANAVTVKTVQNQNNTIDFLYEKLKPGSYTIRIKFNRLENSSSSNIEKVIQNDFGLLYTLRPRDPNKPIGISYSVVNIPGNLKAKADTLYTYLLPFKNGKKYKITQNNDVKSTYFNKEKDSLFTSYAIRTATPDSIFAMRKGIVIQVNQKELQTFNQKDLVYSSERHNIIIEHEDGTYARYIGLSAKSIKVKEGDIVYPTSYLGLSDVFNDEKHLFQFDLYYPDKASNIIEKNHTITYRHFKPFFHTAEGDLQLEYDKEHTAEVKKEYIITEMSKKEIKSFLKI